VSEKKGRREVRRRVTQSREESSRRGRGRWVEAAGGKEFRGCSGNLVEEGGVSTRRGRGGGKCESWGEKRSKLRAIKAKRKYEGGVGGGQERNVGATTG